MALTTAAFAADIPELAVPEAPLEVVAERNWGGFYVGIQGGYAFGEVDIDNIDGSDIAPPGDFDVGEFDVDHFLGGIYSGYNRQFGRFVFGIDNSVSYTDFDESFDAGDDFDADLDDANGDNNIDNIDVDMQYLVTTRGRIGIALDKFMLFAAGGVALANVEVAFESSNGDNEDEHLATGWTAGAGVEALLTDHISARVEYLYVDIDEEYSIATPLPSYEADFEFKEHIVRGGIAYKF